MSSHKYTPCPVLKEKQRRLFIATCDTRIGWKEFNALKVWNVSSSIIRARDKLIMENVCKGENWGKHGFLTKPLLYLKHMKTIAAKHEDRHLNHIILMDSDTFWSAAGIDAVWNKYDCARKGKHMVLSTEMSCWVGRFCAQGDIDRWYNNSIATPSYSPFANSGVIMGRMDAVIKMLEYVVQNNGSYFTKYKKDLKFDDQYAIADYAINVAPQEVQLDYHQEVSASFSLHAPGDPPEPGWPFVCKDRTGKIDMSCPNYTMLLKRLGHFDVNKTTCLAERRYWAKMPLQEELESLAPDPLIWHGNGAGKRQYQDVGYASFKCFLAKLNMTEADHLNTYG